MKHIPEIIFDYKGDKWVVKDYDNSHTWSLAYKREENPCVLIMKPRHVETDFTKKGRPKPESKIIKQGKWECAPAALAMLLEENLSTVKRAMASFGWNNTSDGSSDEVIMKAARKLGRDMLPIDTKDITEDIGPCLITVPSLNYEGKSHAIAWNEKEMLDPNFGYRGRKYWGPEWAPWTVGALDVMVLLDYVLSPSERREMDRLHKKNKEAKLKDVKKQVIDQLNALKEKR